MIAMAGGLTAGYGTFASLAVRYAFPTDVETPWLYVAPATELDPGESLVFESPVGVKLTIARRLGGNESADPAEQFIALSSICPHLGCRVHWEPHNKRFFCPCHNGVFDPEGKPVSGPPKSAEQELRTNLLGPYALTRALWAHMKARRHGCICTRCVCRPCRAQR